jgi:hypothetical protein
MNQVERGYSKEPIEKSLSGAELILFKKVNETLIIHLHWI